jgi:predicted dienelactone hydrolase
MILFTRPKSKAAKLAVEQKQATVANNRLRRFLSKKLILIISHLAFSLSLPIILAQPVRSAERIYVNYGPLEFSLPIKALETYAKTGKIEEGLDFFADYLTKEQLEQLRQTLISPVDLTPVAISQFLYSPQGETILRRVGQVIQTTSRQSGFYALRSALILAATNKEGLNLLTVLQKFPTYGIRINSENGLAIINDLDNLLQITENTISVVRQQANREIQNSPPIDVAALPDLRKRGPIPYSQATLELEDPDRDRKLPIDFYLPQQQGVEPTPLIIISHGLGSDRTTYTYLAEHLASYGFAVAAIEHPGSNASQIQALLNGFAREVTPPQEIIDRPLDVKFLLDYLEDNYSRQLNVQKVGIIGQSFGAYTALALAGARIDYNHLENTCEQLDSSLNISLILQCLGLKLPKSSYDFHDRRIAAAIAINPLTSAFFGQASLSQIKIPVTIIAGSDDPITPALSEQIEPFTWLTVKDKYLAVLQKGTHFSTLGVSSIGEELAFPTEVIGPDPKIAQNYVKAIGLAFFGTYITGNSQYQPYLNASYAHKISNQAMPLDLIKSIDLKLK